MVTIENLLVPWRADPRWVAVARSDDGLGHPLILSPFLAASLAGLQVFEYSAREIKLALTGHGGAAKSQVGYMLQKILRLVELPSKDDESDALAELDSL